MPTVNIEELKGAVAWVSNNSLMNEAYICRETGHIYWVPDDVEMGGEWEDAPDDIQNIEKYVLVPDNHYLDLGNKLAFDFAAQYLAAHYDDVRTMFRRKGAFSQFKDLLHEKDLLEDWYAFSEEQSHKALEDWCEFEGFGVER
jgi:hypothetical protein